MKRIVIAALALGILGAAGAFAGKGGPIIAGTWDGAGKAIYMDGTVAQIIVDSVSISQDGNFVYGDTRFTVKIGRDELPVPPGKLSGYIHGNVLKGTFGVCMSAAPDCLGAAVFEGKVTGKTISGTVIDLSDGSTGVVTLHRVAD